MVVEAVGHAGYKCYLFVEPSELAAGWDRDSILEAVLEHDVPCFSGSCRRTFRIVLFVWTVYFDGRRLYTLWFR